MPRHFPIGAEILPEGVSFRVWAPEHKTVEVVDESPAQNKAIYRLTPEGNGYFSGTFPEFAADSLYRFRIDKEPDLFADPASRYQPDGPFGPSQIIDPAFNWTDQQWRGMQVQGKVIYEMHIGTFTTEGTYNAAIQQLPELAELGVDILEIMPLNEFAGAFGWGYDGVNLFAPTHLYGPPEELRRFVDQAHKYGLAVVIDVVYNHFGPEGNFIDKFYTGYFQERDAEWGRAINFDNPETRTFFLTNVLYWIEEFHFDGIRVDATQAINSNVPPSILYEISRTAHQATTDRMIIVIGENEPQRSELMYPPDKGGDAFDAIWNDDFHHTAIVRMTGRREAYYTDYKGTAQEFISCLKYGFLFQGQYYTWQENYRGTPGLDLKPANFINFLQNHDQVANSGIGQRIGQLTDLGTLKTMTCLLLISPCIPMLFQGQEFGCSNPFFYFAHHERDLRKLVHEGRKEFLSQFPHLATQEMSEHLKNPSDIKTFLSSKLNFEERITNKHIYQLHKDLIKLKKTDEVFATLSDNFDAAVFSYDAFVIRCFGCGEGDRLILINFGVDYELNPAPEPLLAPPRGCMWKMIWTSEAVEYGGQSTPRFEKGVWKLQGHSAVILKSIPLEAL